MARKSKKVIILLYSVLVKQQLECHVWFAPPQFKKVAQKQEKALWQTTTEAEAQSN